MKFLSRTPFAICVGIACIAWLADPVDAQMPPAVIRHLTPSLIDWPYGRSAVGDFDNDGNIDVAYQSEWAVDVMMGPGIYNAEMLGIASVNDFDVLVKPGADNILTVSSAGLSERNMEPNALSSEPPYSPWAWSSTVRAAGDWQNATLVRAWSKTPDLTYVFGVSADGLAILSMVRDVNATPMWSAGPTVTLSAGPTILGIEPYDRDGSKVINVSNPDAGYRPEIAVMRAQALTVYAPFGLQPSTAIAHYPTTTLDNFAISRLRNHVGNKEWVAIFSTLIANPNLQYMATEGQNGVTNGQALPGSRAIGNLTCGDADGDGDHDIVFSMKTSWDLGVLANTPSGTGVPQFNMTSCLTWIWPPEGLGDVTGNVAKPIVADIDNDGDNDCGQTMANSWEMWFDRNQLLSNEELQPKLKLEPDDDPMTEEVGVQIYDAPRRIRFTFELPAPPDDAWPDDYWLDLAIWAQPTDGNMSCDPEAEPPPPPLAARAFYHPPKINLADYAATHIPPDVVGYPQSGYVTVPQPISSSGSGFDQIVYIVAQIVILDDSGALVSAWPGAVYVACAKSTPVDFGDPLTDATDVVAYVQCLLDMQEQTHVEYAVSSNVEPSLITVSQLGQKVGLGGHVPCMPAPVNAPPSKD